jgi:leucyl/phenylalanyl-tRNA--protein transferase
MQLVDLDFPPAPLFFPDPRAAREEVIASSRDIPPGALLDAYSHGIFPWPSHDWPFIPWVSPMHRGVIEWDRVRINRTTRKALRRLPFRLSMDEAFADVMSTCGEVHTRLHGATWILPAMLGAYAQAHEEGWAHSCEAWEGEQLVGGIYGLSLGGVFFGESMFSIAPNGSKAALLALCMQLEAWGFAFLDCQQVTGATLSMGAREIDRPDFLRRLRRDLQRPTRLGPWTLEHVTPQSLAAWRPGEP